MDQIKNFDEFYQIKLKPYLDDLRWQNKKADRWGVISVLACVFIIPALVFGLSDASGNYGGWIIVWAIATIIVSVYNYTKTNDEYESNFKEQIIKQVIDFIHPGLKYKPDSCISSVNYKNSSLYRGYYDDYDGDDLIEGTYKNVYFKCSELNVSRRNNSIVFKGLFFEAPLNNCSGGTYVWLKNNLQLPASIADERYRLIPMPQVVRVDCHNGDFEKHYAVYTTDINEASSLIDAQMMQCIMDFKRQINRDFVLSFVAGMCYVAIPINERLLEPQSGDPADKEEIQNYFFTVLLILSIINKLKLQK
ncbi:MAG: DUF3137 domain-containing protein [Chitinophagaceae bacterium]|nr:DUF3137 domain-containing protein [Chitinophagaceae bacterium]